VGLWAVLSTVVNGRSEIIPGDAVMRSNYALHRSPDASVTPLATASRASRWRR